MSRLGAWRCWRRATLLAALAAGAGLAAATPDATRLPDPMQPPFVAAASAAPEAGVEKPVSYQLQGTRLDARNRNAVINGQLVKEGEQIDGATVLKISKTSVVIETGEQPSTLRLVQHDVKQRARVAP